MSQPPKNCRISQTCNQPTFNQPQICNQPKQIPPFLTEQKIKEVVMDTLIELNLIAKTEKKKGLPDV